MRSLVAFAVALLCTVNPLSAALTDSQLIELDALITAQAQVAFDGGVPGVVIAVAQGKEIIASAALGVPALTASYPVTVDTNFRLASVSKQFTAMSILILRDRGLLSLDDTLAMHFPEIPKDVATKITIRHLLTHTSGVISYENLMPDDQTEQVHDSDVLDLVATQHGMYFTPGTAYRYSNSGYALLALIVERVSGMTYPEFLEENIFAPLDMGGSVAFVDGVNTVPHRAMGYAVSDEMIIPRDQSSTSAVLGDGGIYCSATDYMKWSAALLGDDFVPSATIEEAFTPFNLADGTSTGYGFGWRSEIIDGIRMVHHNGSTCGFSTGARRLPEQGLTVIVLTNLNRGSAGDRADVIAHWLIEQVR